MRYTSLNNSVSSFSDMIKRFGVVTVMNADVYDLPTLVNNWSKQAYRLPTHTAEEAKIGATIDGVKLETGNTYIGKDCLDGLYKMFLNTSGTMESVPNSIDKFFNIYSANLIYLLAQRDKNLVCFGEDGFTKKTYQSNPNSISDFNFYSLIKPLEIGANDEKQWLKKAHICTLDTLKIANATQEGPSKTITGGRYANPLIKFGKTMRLEMQDALGNNEALDALCGTVTEYLIEDENKYKTDSTTVEKPAPVAVHTTEDFTGEKLIIGDTFFIDQKTGKQVKVKIIFFKFLPDSIFNLTQDAEGDATVFDMNGDLLTAELLMGNKDGAKVIHGSFYAIIDPKDYSSPYTFSDGKKEYYFSFVAAPFNSNT